MILPNDTPYSSSSSSPKGGGGSGSYAPSLSSTTAESMTTNSTRQPSPSSYRTTSSNKGGGSASASAYPFHYLSSSTATAAPKARSQPGLSSTYQQAQQNEQEGSSFLAHVHRFAALEQQYSMSEVNYATTSKSQHHRTNNYAESAPGSPNVVSDRIRHYQDVAVASSSPGATRSNPNHRSAALAVAADHFRSRHAAATKRPQQQQQQQSRLPPDALVDQDYDYTLARNRNSQSQHQSQTQTQSNNNMMGMIDTPAPTTVEALKRQLWDDGEQLQVPAAPRGSYLDNSEQLFSDKVTTRRKSLNHNTASASVQRNNALRRERLHSRSLSPSARRQRPLNYSTGPVVQQAQSFSEPPPQVSQPQQQFENNKLFQSRFYQAAARSTNKKHNMVVSNVPSTPQTTTTPAERNRSHSFSSKPFDEPPSSRMTTPQRQHSYGAALAAARENYHKTSADDGGYVTSSRQNQQQQMIHRQDSLGSASTEKRFGASARVASSSSSKNVYHPRSASPGRMSISRVASRDASIERSLTKSTGSGNNDSREAPSPPSHSPAGAGAATSALSDPHATISASTSPAQPFHKQPKGGSGGGGVAAFWQQKVVASTSKMTTDGRPPPSPNANHHNPSTPSSMTTMMIRQKPSWASSVEQPPPSQQQPRSSGGGSSANTPPSSTDTTGNNTTTQQLLDRLKAVRRDNPVDALAQIDAILGQLDAVAAANENNITQTQTPTDGPQQQRTSMELINHKDDDENDDDDDDSDDDTSVSSITNPTYASAQMMDKIKVQEQSQSTSTATYRRPRPSNLQHYTSNNNHVVGVQQKESRTKQKARILQEFPPPNTIKVKEQNGTNSASSSTGSDDKQQATKWDTNDSGDGRRSTVMMIPTKSRRHPWDDSIPAAKSKAKPNTAKADNPVPAAAGSGGMETSKQDKKNTATKEQGVVAPPPPRVASPVNPFDDLVPEKETTNTRRPVNPFDDDESPLRKSKERDMISSADVGPTPNHSNPFDDDPFYTEPSPKVDEAAVARSKEAAANTAKNPFNDEAAAAAAAAAATTTPARSSSSNNNPFNDESSFPSNTSSPKVTPPSPEETTTEKNVTTTSKNLNPFTEDRSFSNRGESTRGGRRRPAGQSSTVYRRQRETTAEAADAFDQAWATFPESIPSQHTRSLDAVRNHNTPPRYYDEDDLGNDAAYPPRPVMTSSSSNPFDQAQGSGESSSYYENQLTLPNPSSVETEEVEEPGIEVSLIDEEAARMNSSSLLDCELPPERMTKEKRGLGRLFKRKDKSKATSSATNSSGGGRSGTTSAAASSSRPPSQLPMIPAPILDQKEAPPPRGRLGLGASGVGMGRSRSASLTKSRFGRGKR